MTAQEAIEAIKRHKRQIQEEHDRRVAEHCEQVLWQPVDPTAGPIGIPYYVARDADKPIIVEGAANPNRGGME